MAQNKNALIRYRVIDNCLSDQDRKWTLEDMMEACSSALQAENGKEINVSKRTLQLDLQMLRGAQLGYNAPIGVFEKKYYRYTDETFSIAKLSTTENDKEILEKSLRLLSYYQEKPILKGLSPLLLELSDRLEESPKIIQSSVKESAYSNKILDLQKAIQGNVVLDVIYQDQNYKKPLSYSVHPQLLVEHNAVWHLVALKKDGSEIIHFSIHDILSWEVNNKMAFIASNKKLIKQYQNVLGLPGDDRKVREIIFKVNKTIANQIEYNPIHSSLKTLKTHKSGAKTFQIDMEINQNLISWFMSHGNNMEVVGPKKIRKLIKEEIKQMVKMYG